MDWVHLKLNDSTQRTVICKDPFVSEDPRIDELVAAIREGGTPGGAERAI